MSAEKPDPKDVDEMEKRDPFVGYELVDGKIVEVPRPPPRPIDPPR